MSTRANIQIKDKYSKLWFYRHSDGYPEGTMPTLEKFLGYIKDGAIRNNVYQSAGWLIILGAQEYNRKFDHKTTTYNEKVSKLNDYKPDLDDANSGWNVGAFEPTSGLRGDIDYLYIIDLDKMTITVIDDYKQFEAA